MEDKSSVILNACTHQNGPLGEGKIPGCLVACPWHGFKYDVRSGRIPASFTVMVPTYRFWLKKGVIQIHQDANPPGTYVEPVPITTSDAAKACNMNRPKKKPLFVGYLPIPKALRNFVKITISPIFIALGIAGFVM